MSEIERLLAMPSRPGDGWNAAETDLIVMQPLLQITECDITVQRI